MHGGPVEIILSKIIEIILSKIIKIVLPRTVEIIGIKKNQKNSFEIKVL